MVCWLRRERYGRRASLLGYAEKALNSGWSCRRRVKGSAEDEVVVVVVVVECVSYGEADNAVDSDDDVDSDDNVDCGDALKCDGIVVCGGGGRSSRVGSVLIAGCVKDVQKNWGQLRKRDSAEQRRSVGKENWE